MHEPVLLREVVELLRIDPAGIYIDGTAGSGGHAEALARRLGPSGRLLAVDRDADAVARASARLASCGCECEYEVVHGNLAELSDLAEAAGIDKADGILFDLGVSSEQLDTADRGFSFMRDGPLDMRMNAGDATTAADVLATWSEAQLVEALRAGGEPRYARRIAKAVVRERRTRALTRTTEFADLVRRATGGRRGAIDPATKAFQAIRMAVNDELAAIRAGIEAGLERLTAGGRMAVISFHSLEDRIVKTIFSDHAGRWESLQQGGSQWVGRPPEVERITRKPVRPAAGEVDDNPRARSAKLRVVERRA